MDQQRTFLDEVPQSDQLTDYDRTHLVLYARLLDADIAGASDDEIARVVFALDPAAERSRAKRVLAAHRDRARWMSKHGYRHLLKPTS
jgi:hypothetical protein